MSCRFCNDVGTIPTSSGSRVRCPSNICAAGQQYQQKKEYYMFEVQVTEMKEITLDTVLDALRFTKKKCLGESILSDKALKIKDLLKRSEAGRIWYEIMSEVIEEKITYTGTTFQSFEKYTPIVPLSNQNGHSYRVGELIFFNSYCCFYDKKGVVGNSMDTKEGSWRFATEEEVRKLYE